MKKNDLVLYKNFCAVVTETGSDSDKFSVQWCPSRCSSSGKKAVYATQKVRNRDVVFLAESQANDFEKSLDFGELFSEVNGTSIESCKNETSKKILDEIKETHELLLSDDETASEKMDFKSLAELFHGDFNAEIAYGLYLCLHNTFYFSESIESDSSTGIGILHYVPRSFDEIEELNKKLFEKENASKIREEFIQRLKQKKLNLPDDLKFMADVESLALGKTDKSKTLHDAGIKETQERAHKILLETEVWDNFRNPYPVRFGLSAHSAEEILPKPDLNEERIEVDHISYAIDNKWSDDPDDAVAFDGKYLWIHIADPASTVSPDSSIDISARCRGATLYIPEGAARMLASESLEDYALGLKEKSIALSFKILLDEKGDIEDCEVLRTIVKVKRLTYEEADELKETTELKPLYEIARRNYERRISHGAVQINMPEIHLKVDRTEKKIELFEMDKPESTEVIREMMLLAGEGAARFAFKNEIPFPYISQEQCNVPSELPEGLAGEFRKRKSMRKRNVSVTPSTHFGLGLGMYSQVTSPLRRYGDLISHQQLRSFLKGEKLMDKDTMLFKISEGDAAAVAGKKAERSSTTHWILVYLLQHPEWVGEAVCLDNTINGGKACIFSIPSLAMETQLTPTRKCELNDKINLKVKAIDLPLLEIIFQEA